LEDAGYRTYIDELTYLRKRILAGKLNFDNLHAIYAELLVTAREEEDWEFIRYVIFLIRAEWANERYSEIHSGGINSYIYLANKFGLHLNHASGRKLPKSVDIME
jgi:hypothetical protein